MSKRRAAPSGGASGFGGFGAGSGFGASGLLSSSSSPLSIVREPLDTTGISNPSVVVQFKNFSKQSEITKQKALDELQAQVAELEKSGTPLEDAFISAWASSYPRLSVDSSRIVRISAHTLLGLICRKEKKRVVPHLGEVTGAWLAGRFDNDKMVSTFAIRSLSDSFDAAKLNKLLEIYHENILSYYKTVLFQETVNSLSDERSVPPDDAKAKFALVISSAVLAIAHLISTLSSEAIKKQSAIYEDIFSNKTLYSHGAHEDATIRKGVYSLLKIAIEKQPDLISSNAKEIGMMVRKAVKTPQDSALPAFVELITAITKAFPSILERSSSKSSKAPSDFTTQIFSSAIGLSTPAHIWLSLAKLSSQFRSSAPTLIPSNLPSVKKLLSAIRKYTEKKPGTRQETTDLAIWRCLLDYTFTILSSEAGEEVDSYILEEILSPTLVGYIVGTAGGDQNMATVGAMVLVGTAKSGRESIFESLHTKIDELVADELDAKTEERPVKPTTGWTTRWATVVKPMLDAEGIETSANLVAESVKNLFYMSTMLAGKIDERSKSAISLIQSVFTISSKRIWDDSEFQSAANELLKGLLPSLIGGASSEAAISSLVAFGKLDKMQALYLEAWETFLKRILAAKNEQIRLQSLKQLLERSPADKQYPKVDELTAFVKETTLQAARSETPELWDAVKTCYFAGGNVLPESIRWDILTTVAEEVNTPELLLHFSKQLEEIARRDKEHFIKFMASEKGAGLLTQILNLSHRGEENLGAAESLAAVVQEAVKSSGHKHEVSAQALDNMVSSIKTSVTTGADGFIPIEYLIERAISIKSDASVDAIHLVLSSLLFSEDEWSSAQASLFSRTIPVAVGMTNPIEGAIYSAWEDSATGSQEYDEQGYSSTWRQAIFAVSVLSEEDFKYIEKPGLESLLYNLELLVEACKDNLDVPDAEILWEEKGSHARESCARVLFQIEELIVKLQSTDEGAESVVPLGTRKMLREATLRKAFEGAIGRTRKSVFNARVLARMLSEKEDSAQSSDSITASWIDQIGQDFTNLALNGALCAAIPSTGSILSNLLQKTVRQITALSFDKSPEEAMERCVFLSLLLNRVEDEALLKKAVSANGLRFLAAHLLEWPQKSREAEDPNETEPVHCVVSEVAKILLLLLPALAEIHGDLWLSMCDMITDYWKELQPKFNDEHLMTVQRTIKLYKAIKALPKDDNDDLFDAWSSVSENFESLLPEVLYKSTVSSVNHVPRGICNALIERELRTIPLSQIDEPERFYKLLNVKSEAIQKAAYGILHRYIPSLQEEISVEAALTAGKDDPMKPTIKPELLSILVNIPSLDEVDNIASEKEAQLVTRTLLLSWLLVFDHFQNATFLVKSAYIEELEKGTYAMELWDFMADCLNLIDSKPFDASSYSVEFYALGEEEDPRRDLRWALLHIYYLALKNSPTLVGAWWKELRNRQLKLSVETLTAKYLSPLIVREELEAVREWRSKQESSAQPVEDSQGTLSLKISSGANEVLASYTVDQQSIEVAIRLPPSFPLNKPSVDGVARVGISEAQFASVIRVTQATMSQQSGSVVDALIIYKKNLDAYLGGIQECAICYFILSLQERTLPQKQCPTCKNKFHSSCLFKWFKTSGGSTCPLCRTGWRFK